MQEMQRLYCWVTRVLPAIILSGIDSGQAPAPPPTFKNPVLLFDKGSRDLFKSFEFNVYAGEAKDAYHKSGSAYVFSPKTSKDHVATTMMDTRSSERVVVQFEWDHSESTPQDPSVTV